MTTGPLPPVPTDAPRPASPWRALVQLAVVVAVVVVLAVASGASALLIVVVAIVAMVMLHELGHFATAKWSGMKVTEYFLGFGPRLWSVRRGETEYGIKAIPAGGYVKIVGMSNLEEVDPGDEPRTYRQQSFPRRLLVAVAGSAMHLVMAVVALYGLVVFVGQPDSAHPLIEAYAPLAHGVDPARAGGLKAGDVVTAVDGRPLSSEDQFVQAVAHHPHQPLRLTVRRDGRTRELTVVPTTRPGSATGVIGVYLNVSFDRSGPLSAVGSALHLTGTAIAGTGQGLATTFSPHGLAGFFRQVTNAKAADQAARTGQRAESIVGAVRIATEGAQAGAYDLIWVLVSIDVFVGVVNLFPMLPLDGGHVLVAVYERLRSRRGRRYHADVAKLMPVATAFVLFLVVFVGSAMFLDITHPVANPFR